MSTNLENSSNPEEEKQEVLTGIFTLEGVNGRSAVKVRHMGNMKLQPGEGVRDTPVRQVQIFDKVKAFFSACNITHTYILASKKQPILSITVLKERPIQSLHLFRMFLFFTNETDVSSADEFLKKKLYGTFSIEAEIGGKYQTLDVGIDKFPGNEELINRLEELLKSDEMKELIEGIISVEEEKLRTEFEKNYGRFVDKSISIQNIADDLDSDSSEGN